MPSFRIVLGLTVVALLAALTACGSVKATEEGDSETRVAPSATPSSTPEDVTANDAGAANRRSDQAERPVEVFEPILEQALPNVRGKSFTSATVSFPAGARALSHRHGQSFVFAYVLEWRVRSQVGGGPVTTYDQGEFWVEMPGAHHLH